jgi:isocitrate lyase
LTVAAILDIEALFTSAVVPLTPIAACTCPAAWKKKLDRETIASFQQELAAMG